ncbi:MAG: flavodoxin family protein [Candidatus Lokiarchaeota archaeon]|nr:flavodoxin family protein [Candidatus Harpocratesius repetitus]
MKVLLLNGSTLKEHSQQKFFDFLVEYLNSLPIDLQIIHLKDKKIAYCNGCFYCWVKTPGKCIIKDDSEEIAKKIIQSDLLIYFTPITFGGYSSLLKRALDRQICLISPFFTKIKGEVHHKKRYNKYPSLLGIGYQKQTTNPQMSGNDLVEQQIFSKLLKRNSINFYSPITQAHIYEMGTDKNEFMNKLDKSLYLIMELNNQEVSAK